jgi:hypothetical protein
VFEPYIVPISSKSSSIFPVELYRCLFFSISIIFVVDVINMIILTMDTMMKKWFTTMIENKRMIEDRNVRNKIGSIESWNVEKGIKRGQFLQTPLQKIAVTSSLV